MWWFCGFPQALTFGSNQNCLQLNVKQLGSQSAPRKYEIVVQSRTRMEFVLTSCGRSTGDCCSSDESSVLKEELENENPKRFIY